MEIEGTIVNRNNRAKEQTLYKVIAEKDAEIVQLRNRIKLSGEEYCCLWEDFEKLKLELRALKSKEYRRSVRRKKQLDREQPD